jgi:hypothetical protein
LNPDLVEKDMLKTFHTLNATDYDNFRFAVMSEVEGDKLTPYSDKVGLPTIGIGVTFRKEMGSEWIFSRSGASLRV